MVTTLSPIEILSLGPKVSHNAGRIDVSKQVLQDLVDTFEPARFVAGHPAEDQEPEYELAKAQKIELKDGKLVVSKYSGVSPATRAAVNSGELNKVSVKIRPPGHPKNPTGKWKLLHIGLFGRNPVADANLADAAFSAAHTEDVLLSAIPSESEATGNSGSQGGELQPPTTPPAPSTQETPVTTTPTKTDAELAAERQQFEQEKADFELRQQTFNRAQAIDPWLEEQIRAGRLLPGEKPMLQAVFSQVPEQDVAFQLGDKAEKVGFTESLKGFIAGLPQRVDYGEVTAPTEGDAEFAKGKDEDTSEKARRKAAAAGLEKWGQ